MPGPFPQAVQRCGVQRGPYPPSSLAFDWVMGILALVLMGGVIQDGWAHSHGLVDQSFLTPWHAILYATMAVNGVVLISMAGANIRRGFPWRRALPYGYWTALTGVIIFAIGGLFDLYWHTRYGIETDVNALISPSHLWLALGGALIFAGPIISIASRFGSGTGGWRISGPAICGATATMILLGFFTQYAQPIGSADEWQILGKQEPVAGGALYAMRSDGTGETRVLLLPQSDIWGVAVSPDGKHIAFRVSRTRDPQSDIFIADANGQNAHAITHSGRHDTQVAWAPDGKHLAFLSIPAGTSGNFQLQTIASNGSDLRTIVDSSTSLQFPVWSPDGKYIAYQSRNGLRQQLAVVSSSGGTPRWLDATVGGVEPAWSQRGIAFSNSDGQIALTDSIGRRATIVVRTPQSAQEPAWSPDLTQIAYIADVAGDAQILIAHIGAARGTNVSQLPGFNVSRPAWTPSGQILFTATGRPPVATTFIGLAYSEDANIIQAIILAGIVLFLIRRWRMPFGAITLLLFLFATALAFQSDLFITILPATIVGLLADVAILFLGERTRSGAGFYTFAFVLPAALFAAYELTEKVSAGVLGWPPNMIAGSPFIAGFSGLLVAFCFKPPIEH